MGCILPAYIFGKLKGIDIRKEGSKNAGTANVYHVLGVSYAIPTALYDTLKGLLAMLIANFLGVDFIVIQLAGFAAIIGHVLPFYLRFRGGQGVATATGMLLMYLVNYFIENFIIMVIIIAFILLLVALFTYISRVGNLLAVVVVPVLAYSVWIYYPLNPYNLFFNVILGYICYIGLRNIIVHKKIVIEDESFRNHWWRMVLRPFAVIFIIFYALYPKVPTLMLIGIVALVFIGVDIARIFHRHTDEMLTQKIKFIFRKGESKRFSSMTLFLIAAFITILLFEKYIAITALTFLIFGDLFSKIFGLAFGKRKLFKKSLEGTLAYMGSVLIFGFILYTIFDISPLLLLIGGAAAAFAEVAPLKLNDNFTVPLISGVAMTVSVFFG